MVNLFFKEMPEIPGICKLYTTRATTSWVFNVIAVTHGDEFYYQLLVCEEIVPLFKDAMLFEEIPPEWKKEDGTLAYTIQDCLGTELPQKLGGNINV